MKQNYLFRIVVLFLLGSSLNACGSPRMEQASPLQLEEHPLAGAPQPEAFRFQPLDGSQQEVLAKHAQDRARVFAVETVMVEGNPSITSLGESSDLLAVLVPSAPGSQAQSVRVLRGDETLLETPAGLPSPVLPLQGLWTYDGHWALEILFADQDTWAGQVFIDGELVNERQGYDEAFGFQLIAGKPFYFFNRDGQLGYAYDGQETLLDYDEIPHYRCCGEGSLNPLQAEQMVAFFGVQDGEWFYVELGDFSG
jgi:hypothetical protein